MGTVTGEVLVLTFYVQPSLKILNCFLTRVTRVQNDFFHSYVPKTSLSSPPWPEVVLPDPAEETRHHAGKRQSERTAAPGPRDVTRPQKAGFACLGAPGPGTV